MAKVFNDGRMSRAALSVPTNLSQQDSSPGHLGQERRISRLGDWVAPHPSSKMEEYQRMDAEESESVSQCLKTSLVSWIPVLGWLPYYDVRRDFFYDFVGGATIALICLVQTLAHAAIATTKVIQGPYCAFVPPFVYALLGTSPHASISSGAIAAILIADQLQYFHDEEERTELASLLALISGGMLVAMGLCRAAYAVRFLSQSLISGFVTGGSVLILVGQLKNLLGLINMRHAIGFIDQIRALSQDVHETNIVGLCLGLAMMMVLQLMMWLKKYVVAELKGPGPKPSWMKPAKMVSEMKELVLVAISITFAYMTCEGGEPILPVVGDIPSGLPPFKPAWRLPAAKSMLETHFRLQEFFMGGFLVALTSFLTTYATSKKQALQHGYQIDASQEMFALGMAGTCGSFFGSFTPSGSLSRTSLASEVGVKTQMSGLMKIVVVGISLSFLTPILYFLPKATLAAIILRSTWQLVDFNTPRTLWASWKPYHQGGMRRDFVVWWIAFVLTIFLGVLWGIGVAVLVSVAMIVHDAALPRAVTLGCIESLGNIWRDKEVWPEGRTYPGVLIVEFRGPLSFASADWFMEELERKCFQAAKRGDKVQYIVLHFGSVHDLDSTAIGMLKDLLTEWRKRSISCIIAEAKSRVRLLLEENYGEGSKPLLDQPAFMISLDDAVQFANLQLARRNKSVAAGLSQDDSGAQSRPGWRSAGVQGPRAPRAEDVQGFQRSTSNDV
mmetsp:Transcript_10907/g.19445  ORF Transcript_10907/g.19445 Transcript_10907/m.19445 type:complete len:728 (+) Transcript_10907:61-2244(+)